MNAPMSHLSTYICVWRSRGTSCCDIFINIYIYIYIVDYNYRVKPELSAEESI